MEGRGALHLSRASDGTVLWGIGVWVPASGELEYEDFVELFRPGAALLYTGPATANPATANDEAAPATDSWAVEDPWTVEDSRAIEDSRSVEDSRAVDVSAGRATAENFGAESEVVIEVEVTAVERCDDDLAGSDRLRTLVRLRVANS